MRCWNCGFENFPGAQACARCTSAMSLGQVAIEPPRASALHFGTRLRRLINRFSIQLPDFRAMWARTHILIPEAVDWPAILWSIVPGLGHLRTGHRRIGRVLLFAWIAFLALAVFSIGATWMLYFFMGAILVHSLAFMQLLANNIVYESLLVRSMFGSLLFLGLYFFAYRPIGLLSSQVYQVEVLDRVARNQLVEDGDGLLIEGPWLRPEQFGRGDLVLYQIGQYGGLGFVVRGGRSIDRIIGVPGDRVQRVRGQVLINGELPKPGEEPPGAIQLSGDFDFLLGPDEYAIATTTNIINPYVNQVPPPHIIRHLTVFSDDDILGRVIYRIRPFSRMGRV